MLHRTANRRSGRLTTGVSGSIGVETDSVTPIPGSGSKVATSDPAFGDLAARAARVPKARVRSSAIDALRFVMTAIAVAFVAGTIRTPQSGYALTASRSRGALDQMGEAPLDAPARAESWISATVTTGIPPATDAPEPISQVAEGEGSELDGSGGVSTSTTPIPGYLTREQISGVVSRKRRRFEACGARELRNHGDFSGRVAVNWTIDLQGHVASAHVVEDTIGSPHLASCILRVVRRLRFDEPDGGRVVVTVPFVYNDPAE